MARDTTTGLRAAIVIRMDRENGEQADLIDVNFNIYSI